MRSERAPALPTKFLAGGLLPTPSGGPTEDSPDSSAAAGSSSNSSCRQKYRPYVAAVAFMGLFMMAVVVFTWEATIMPRSIQQELSPPDRAAQLAMKAFLTPVSEIFSFIEDAMIIRVSYAIARKDTVELNVLLHLSVLGGLACGLVAFVLCAALAEVESTAAAILNPSAAANGRWLLEGCSLVPSTSQLLLHAKPYWLLTAAAWMPSFATKGLLGFFAGVGRFGPYLAPMLINATVPLVVWFGLMHGGTVQPLTALGLAYGLADWVVALSYGGYFLMSKELRAKYGLRCLICRGCQRQRLGVTLSDNAGAETIGKKLLSRFCANYQRNTGLLSRDVTH
eukprot:SAG31_NODE_2135_length_6364_cov_4.367438_5_plen_339_part_00